MIVDPDFFDHWRTGMVVNALKDQAAPVYIMRLWAHCQERKSDTFAIPPEGLKAQCKCPADAADFERALSEAGFIARDGATITVVGWAEKNASLIAAWGNGVRGGRPRKNPAKTHGLPMANPEETRGEPMANPRVTDKRREEKRRGDEIREDGAPRQTRAEPAGTISSQDLVSEGVSEQHAKDWLKVRSKHRAPLTQTAWDGVKAEAAKAGITPARAVEICARQSWRGFDSTWDWPGKGAGPLGASQPNRQEALEIRNRAIADEWVKRKQREMMESTDATE